MANFKTTLVIVFLLSGSLYGRTNGAKIAGCIVEFIGKLRKRVSKEMLVSKPRRKATFKSVFPRSKPIIAMIHLAGHGREKFVRAHSEMEIFERLGVDAVIIENYHGRLNDVEQFLSEVKEKNYKLILGINILPNEYDRAFDLADKYGVKFIQMDFVAGRYLDLRGVVELDEQDFQIYRDKYPHIIILGGIHPKYYKPLPGSDLEVDIQIGLQRADAIVVTGEGTGLQTPMEKIEEFRRILGTNVPLIIGAGVDIDNVNQQLKHGDGVIIGSYFKNGDTRGYVVPSFVSKFMSAVNNVRASE